jgi:hypothetical protein
MVLTFLSDFTKRSTDLWKKKKFTFNKSLEVNVDTKNTIAWEAKHVIKDKAGPESTVTLKQKEEGLGDLEVEWSNVNTPNFKLTTKELADDLEVQLEMKGTDNYKCTTTYGSGTQWAAKCEAAYKAEKLVLDTQVSVAYDKVTFGAQGKLDAMDGSLQEYNVGVRLDQDEDRTYALRSQDKFNELQVAFHYRVSPTCEIGTEIDVDMGKGRIDVTGGGIYKLDDNSKLRYALTSKSDLMLSYEYKFSSTVCGSVGTTYSLTENNMTGPLGYKLKFDC